MTLDLGGQTPTQVLRLCDPKHLANEVTGPNRRTCYVLSTMCAEVGLIARQGPAAQFIEGKLRLGGDIAFPRSLSGPYDSLSNPSHLYKGLDF